MKLLTLFAADKIDPSSVGIPAGDANTVINGVLSTAYFAAGVVCVIVIIIAGILFATADGSPQQIARARNAIIYALVGLVVVLMAFVITGFVIGWFR